MIFYHDAEKGNQAADISALLESLPKNATLIIRKPHWFTTKAFNVLYTFLQNADINLILVETDKPRVLPPILEYRNCFVAKDNN